MSIDPLIYNADYFENGSTLGISGYANYSWLPDLTIRMAQKFIQHLPIEAHHTVLDFGCAKGFLVKALRILNIKAYGVDISEYAIDNADGAVREFCWQIANCNDPKLFRHNYDWILAKDVFEHLSEYELAVLLRRAWPATQRIFVVVPLAYDDVCGEYIISDYDLDITHVICKSFIWWQKTFVKHNWRIELAAHEFPGCKENWTAFKSNGNGFFILTKNY